MKLKLDVAMVNVRHFGVALGPKNAVGPEVSRDAQGPDSPKLPALRLVRDSSTFWEEVEEIQLWPIA